MRWTIRGIPGGTADAVRAVAGELNATLGEVVSLCIELGLPTVRRYLRTGLLEQTGFGFQIVEGLHEPHDVVRHGLSGNKKMKVPVKFPDLE